MSTETPRVVVKSTFGIEQSALAELQDLAANNHGELTPELVVRRAVDPGNPLHRYFEWDNDRAAVQYRLHQAAGLLRKVKVIIETTPSREIVARAYVATRDPKDGVTGVYSPIQDVMNDPRRRELVLSQIRRDVQSLQHKLSVFEEYGYLIEALDRFMGGDTV